MADKEVMEGKGEGWWVRCFELEEEGLRVFMKISRRQSGR